MGKGSFGDDDAFWKEFAATNNIGSLDNGSNNKDEQKSPPDLGSPSGARNTQSGGKPADGSRPSEFKSRRTRTADSSVKTISQFMIALAIAAIPIGFYLVKPDNVRGVFSAVFGASLSTVERGRALEEEARRINATLTNLTSTGNSKVKSDRVLSAKLNQAAALSQKLNNFQSTEKITTASQETALSHAVKHLDPTYVCPMHSSVATKVPGSICPICGMDLVLVETGAKAGLVTLTPTVMNSLGVRTAKVKRRTLYRRINSVGYINVDENNIRVVTLRTEGWVERLVVKTSGEHVKKGQLLFEIYSPILVNAQDEYLQALRHNNKPLIGASLGRLEALGISRAQIDTLRSSKKVEQLVQVYAPQDGIISELNVREGMHVEPSQVIVNLVDLSSVWLMVDIFERQASWVQKGQRAEATLPFMPGRSWEGMVEYIYPSLDASTRSLKVRLRFDNIKEELKPNMYADVAIYAKPKRNVLAIPREALIRTGEDQRVIVALGEGKFMPMSVQVGMETDSKIEILSGLAEGDVVVTSSQFLIDSESSLKAGLAKLAAGS